VWGISSERTQYWKSLLEQLARIRDVRTREPLRAAFRDFTNTYFDHHKQAKRIVAPFVIDGEPLPAFSDADRALVAGVARAIDGLESKDLHRGLVAAIAASPADDAPRQVYADWLLERQHPRGEAIVQLSKGERPELTPYLYGPLHDLGAIGYDQLDRGLPTRLPLHWGASTLNWRAVARHPLVQTIETLDVGEVQQPPTGADLFAFARAATRLQGIHRVEQDREKTLWALADAALAPLGFHRLRGSFVRELG
jgi:uncharacterized protein (TIGR02996 family)